MKALKIISAIRNLKTALVEALQTDNEDHIEELKNTIVYQEKKLKKEESKN